MILLIDAALVGGAVYGCSQIAIEFDMESFIGEGTPFARLMEVQKKYCPRATGVHAHFYVHDNASVYSHVPLVKQVADELGARKDLDGSYIQTPWFFHKQFLGYLEEESYSLDGPNAKDDFHRLLAKFLYARDSNLRRYQDELDLRQPLECAGKISDFLTIRIPYKHKS